jgi:hypothetical protein
MPTRFAYSLNGENYTGDFASRDQALAAALDAARDPLNLAQPQSVFVGRRVEPDPHTAGHAKTILRAMAWQAHDDVGSPAANYLNQLSDDQVAELDGAVEQILQDWLRRHDLLPKYFKVEGISEHPVPMPKGLNGRAPDTREVHQVGQTFDIG